VELTKIKKKFAAILLKSLKSFLATLMSCFSKLWWNKSEIISGFRAPISYPIPVFQKKFLWLLIILQACYFYIFIFL